MFVCIIFFDQLNCIDDSFQSKIDLLFPCFYDNVFCSVMNGIQRVFFGCFLE